MELLQIISLNWAATICLILGLVLVAIEMFTPGFGVPGISGLALLLAGIIVASDSLLEGIVLTIIIIVLMCVLLAIAMYSASKGALAKTPLVLKEAARREEGFTSGEDMGFFLGREGVTTSMLRPVGSADFDGVRLEVLADGAFIEAGKKIRVVRVEGHKLVVSRTDKA